MRKEWHGGIYMRNKSMIQTAAEAVEGLGGSVRTHATGITITKRFPSGTRDRVIDEFILGLPFAIGAGLCRTSLDADDVTVTQETKDGVVTLLVFFPWLKE